MITIAAIINVNVNRHGNFERSDTGQFMENIGQYDQSLAIYQLAIWLKDVLINAVNHLMERKRNFLYEDFVESLNSLSKQFREPAIECANSRTCPHYGKALLKLAGMDLEVLWNTLEHVSKEDEYEDNMDLDTAEDLCLRAKSFGVFFNDFGGVFQSYPPLSQNPRKSPGVR